MLSIEIELKKYLKKVKRNLTGLSWRERRACLREIEYAIRERAADIAKEGDDEATLRKSMDSMGEPEDIAREYSITTFERPTLRTYLLLSLNATLATILIVIGAGPALFKTGYDHIYWSNPSTLEILGTLVVLLGIPSLVLFLVQIFLSRSIPWLRTYVLLPFLTSLLFGAILVYVIVGDNIVEVIRDPHSFFGYGWILLYLLFLGVIAFFPFTALVFLWFYVDTAKYELFIKDKRVHKGDYVRAVIGQLTSLDIMTKRCIREELERDIDERLQEIGDGMFKEDELYSVLGNPNDVALMLLKSHGPRPKERIRRRFSIPIALLAGISLVVALGSSMAVLDVMTDPWLTFGASALLLSFPLLIVAIALWTYLARMIARPMKRRDLFVPAVVLAIAAVLILASNLGVALADNQFSKASGFGHGNYFVGSSSHGNSEVAVFWIKEEWSPCPHDDNVRCTLHELHVTVFDSKGEVRQRKKVFEWKRWEGFIGYHPDIHVTEAGNHILVSTNEQHTTILKVSKDGDLLDNMYQSFHSGSTRLIGDVLYIAWTWSGLGLAAVNVEPNLVLVKTWEEPIEGSDPGYRSERGTIIGQSDVQALRTISLHADGYSSTTLKSFSFDFDGNRIGEFILESLNVTRQSTTDSRNRTGIELEMTKHLQGKSYLAAYTSIEVINGDENISFKAVSFDSDVGQIRKIILHEIRGSYMDTWFRCVDGWRKPNYHSESSQRFYFTYLGIEAEYWNPNSSDVDWFFNVTGISFYLSVFEENGTFLAQTRMGTVNFPNGWYNMQLIETNVGPVVLWGYVNVTDLCYYGIDCEGSFNITYFDLNGTVRENEALEISSGSEVMRYFSFEPVETGRDEIVGVVEDEQRIEIIAPEIQLKEWQRRVVHLYLTPLDSVSDMSEKQQVTDPYVYPDEILQMIVAIIGTSLAITILHVGYLKFRKEKGETPPAGPRDE